MEDPKVASHINELNNRKPPVVNVNLVIYKKHEGGTLFDPEIFVGKQLSSTVDTGYKRKFPGSRLQMTESPQEAIERIIQKECKGLQVLGKRLITAQNDQYDPRSRNINLYYLCEYVGGSVELSDSFVDHQWIQLQKLKKREELRTSDALILNDIDQAISLVNSSSDEMLVEVDEHNKEIGSISKKEAHYTNLRHHRAAHIFVFTTKGETLLQQRSAMKSSDPLKRDMHGGHQIFGQTIEQCARAELSEEVGISGNLMFHSIKHFTRGGQSEFGHLYYIIHNGPYGYDSNEVKQLQIFDCQKLIDGGYDQEYEILPHLKDYLEDLKSIWKPLIRYNKMTT